MPAGQLVDEMVRGVADPARGNRGVGPDPEPPRRGVRRRLDDPHVRQDLAVLHTRRAIMGYTNLRMRSSSVPGLEGPISKITVSDITRGQRDLGLAVQGAYGMLADDDAPSAGFQDFALSSPATSIAGGTDEIQRNHLGREGARPASRAGRRDRTSRSARSPTGRPRGGEPVGRRPAAGRRPGPGPVAGGRRPALHAPAGRARRRRHQARAARRRPDPCRSRRPGTPALPASCSSTWPSA